MSDSLFLYSLKLQGFKNHERVTCEFSPAFNGISGLNGKGKTNLFDAIHYLVTGKSYFNFNDRMSIMTDAVAAHISGVFMEDDLKTDISVAIPLTGSKQIKTDGSLCKRLSDYIGRFSAVMITPDDIAIIVGGSENRRSFMDRIICQHNPSYLLALNRYQKILEQRNHALKKMDESGIFNAELIDTYNNQLAIPAQEIYTVRKAFVEWMAPVAEDIYQKISNDRDHINLLYDSQLHEHSFAELMAMNVSKDRVLCRTSAGIHKDELVMTLGDGLDVRKYGSQGQVKSWIISMKLAALCWLKTFKKQSPILLLDDIFEKIDDVRLKNLLTWIEENHQGQWFVTDAHTYRLHDYVQTIGVEKKFFNIDETFHESGKTHQTSAE